MEYLLAGLESCNYLEDEKLDEELLDLGKDIVAVEKESVVEESVAVEKEVVVAAKVVSESAGADGEVDMEVMLGASGAATEPFPEAELHHRLGFLRQPCPSRSAWVPNSHGV